MARRGKTIAIDSQLVAKRGEIQRWCSPRTGVLEHPTPRTIYEKEGFRGRESAKGSWASCHGRTGQVCQRNREERLDQGHGQDVREPWARGGV